MSDRLQLLLTFRGPYKTIAALLCCSISYLWLMAGPVHALDPNKRITQYLHKSWRIQDGSLPATGNSITQTSDGFLWLGAGSEGLYRFDGVRFVPWPIPIKGKPIKTITNIYGDHSGGLWVLGEREIIHLKAGVVTSHLELPGLQLFERIREDPDGSLWVVRGQYDVSDEPLCRISDSAVQCFGKADGIPIAPAGSLLADSHGDFWIGGQTALVHWRNGASKLYPIEGLKHNAGGIGVNSLARGADGSVWVGILKTGPGLGLGVLKDGVFKPFVTARFDGSELPVTSMRLDRAGSLWVGTTNQGLFRIYGDVVEHYGRADGLSGDFVAGLFEDRDGTLWVTTTNGVDSFRDPPITVFSAVEGLALDAAVGLLATKDGTIWIANAGSLDRIVNGTVTSILAGQGLPGSQVAYMLEDSAGNLWVGVDDGLYHFKNGQFRRIDPPDKPFGMVLAMIEDIDGNIWAACVGPPRKLLRIRDFRVVEEFSASQVPPGHYFAPDPKGGIWITTLEGEVILLRNGAIETRFPLNPGGDPYNRQIIVQADGSVLASSENGLVGWRKGRVQRMTTKNGLPCNTVVSFIEDKQKQWWLNTHCGVIQFPDSELQRWWANPDAMVHTRLYDVFDGARLSGEPSFNSAALSPDGRVWFATGFVVMMLDPSRLSKESPPAVTFIESITVDRKQFAPTDKLKLSPHPRDLQIHYTSPSFLNPEKVKFRYRLEGYDSDWRDAGIRRQAFYTDVPPGDYSFQVIACNSDGVWNNTPARLAFSIAPAYYQTNWFRALIGVMLMGLLLVAYQLRVRQLHEDLKKLRDVIETIPAMAFTFLPDGSNAYVNRRWSEFTGLSAEQTVGSGWMAAIHPDDLHLHGEQWRTFIAAGQPFEFEGRFRSGANEEYRWVLARVVPQRDRHGKIRRWYGILTDIEDRKRAEEALQVSEKQLKIEVEERSSLLDLTHDSISVLDMEFNIRYWNQGAEEFYGWTREEAIGKRCDELLRTVYPKPVEEIRRELLEKDQWEGELTRTKADGARVVVLARWSLRRDQRNRPVAILETSNDITARKRWEEEIQGLNQELAKRSMALETSNKDLEGFAYSVSHDLRAPLRHVSGFAELLRKTAIASLNEKSARYVNLILEESNRMGILIDDLLAFSRITRAERHNSMISLEQLVAEVIAEVSQDAGDRKIIWKTHPLPEWCGDRSMLRLALVNLISNAVKFTRKRSEAEIEIGCSENKDDQIVLFIRDNGVGFDMKYYNKLFGVFQRLHAQEDFEGTGIGLATVQRIVRHHGGRVWAEGKVDRGATFYFSLYKIKQS